MKKFIETILLVLVLSVMLTACDSTKSNQIEIHNDNVGIFKLTFITIGKGDSFLLNTPNGKNYIIDTGKDQDFRHIARLLKVKGVEKIDGIFLTHGHKDHSGGLDMILEVFDTDTVYFSAKDNITYTEINPTEISEKHKVKIQKLNGGEKIDLGGVEAEIYIPSNVDTKNGNNNSIVMRLTHGKNSFLMMGDAEMEEEIALMSSGINIDADILKLGHHGEDDASSPAFLDKVDPDIAIIAGNELENPESINETVSENLKIRNIEPFYSECEGLAIDFISDGENITTDVVLDKEFDEIDDVEITDVDIDNQKITLTNTDDDDTVSLDGCFLFTKKLDLHYFFPKGTILAPGESITVSCLGHESEKDLIWNVVTAIKKKNEKIKLYDSNINMITEISVD